MIKKLEEELEKKFTCLGENTEKCITFSIPIENEVRGIDKNREIVTKTISYRLQFIDSARLWQAHYQILLVILLKEFKIKCKYEQDDKKCETCGIKYKDWACFLEYINFKDDLIEYKNTNVYIVIRIITKSLMKT